MRIGTVCRARGSELRNCDFCSNFVPEAALYIGAAEKSPQRVPCGTGKGFNKV